MTTIADLEATLPWGFHDAHVESIEIDWLDAKPVAARSTTRALFAGDDIPDPSRKSRRGR